MRTIVPVGLVLFLSCAATSVHGREGPKMTQCAITVRPGASLGDEMARVPEGGVLCLEPGRYAGGLRVERSVTIRPAGNGEVVLDAGGQGTVVHVAGDRARVVLEGLTLTGGNSQKGAAVVVSGTGANVVLKGCRIARNRARTKWLGAVLTVLNDNHLVMERCRVVDNDSDDESGPGQAMVVTTQASVEVTDSLVAGRAGKGGSLVSVREGARLVIERATVVNEGAGRAIEVLGTTTDRPAVTVADSIVSGGEAIRSEGGAAVAVDRSVVWGDVAGPATLGADVRRADPAFEKHDPEPYRPLATSPAVGLARGGGRDLTGRSRPDTRATAGAIER